MSARLSMAPLGSRDPAPAVPRISAEVMPSFSSIGWSASSTTSAVMSLVMEAIGAGFCASRSASTDASAGSKM